MSLSLSHERTTYHIYFLSRAVVVSLFEEREKILITSTLNAKWLHTASLLPRDATRRSLAAPVGHVLLAFAEGGRGGG